MAAESEVRRNAAAGPVPRQAWSPRGLPGAHRVGSGGSEDQAPPRGRRCRHRLARQGVAAGLR